MVRPHYEKNVMNDTTPGAFNINFTPRDLIVPTAVVTSTVILTAGVWRVVGQIALPPLHRLNKKLEKKSEKLKNSNKN